MRRFSSYFPAVLLALTAVPAAAALHDRGGGFVYDDVLNVTWAKADGPGFNPGNTRDWYGAVEWADSLALYDSVRDTTWDDWRLATHNVDGSDFIPVDCAVVTELECRNNEYGYIYHYYGIRSGSSGPLGNIPNYHNFWTGDDIFPQTLEQNFNLNMLYGDFYVNFFPRNHATFAVREGDVAPDFDASIAFADPLAIHPHHNSGPLNDSVKVIVLGASTIAGDLVDLNTADIVPEKLRLGPGGGQVDPRSTPEFGINHDDDGIDDASFEFLMGNTGLTCEMTEAQLIGELQNGDIFVATDTIAPDCDAGCHN